MNKNCVYDEWMWLDSLKNRLGVCIKNGLGVGNVSDKCHYIWLFVLFVYDMYVVSG